MRLEPTKLILIGTRTTYQATGECQHMACTIDHQPGIARLPPHGTEVLNRTTQISVLYKLTGGGGSYRIPWCEVPSWFSQRREKGTHRAMRQRKYLGEIFPTLPFSFCMPPLCWKYRRGKSVQGVRCVIAYHTISLWARSQRRYGGKTLAQVQGCRKNACTLSRARQHTILPPRLRGFPEGTLI